MHQQVLNAMRRAGGYVSVKRLAGLLQADPDEVQEAVDELERRGLVERYDGGASNAARVFRAKRQRQEAT